MIALPTQAEPTEFDFPVEEEVITPLDKGEGSLDLELKAYPPITDAIDKVKAIDWDAVRFRALLGVNAVGAGLSVLGRAIYSIGESLKQV